jgi:tetratricopeptide (TPR) repeat protein
MVRALSIVLLLALTATAAREAVQFRLKKDPDVVVRGWARDVGRQGFDFEEFGGRRRLFVPWEALLGEDATKLRRRFQIEWLESVKPQSLGGHRIHFRGGGSIDGLLERVDDRGRHWVRTGGLFLPYPKDRIARIQEVQVLETAVYDVHEIYLRHLEQRPPRDAAEHRYLADYMFDIGNWSRAVHHYRAAAEAKPTWTAELESRIQEVEDIMADEKASKVFSKAKARAVLHGDHERAIEMIEEYVAAHPEAKRRGYRILDQLVNFRQNRLERRFTRVKHEEFDRAVDRYLARHKPDLSDAMKWVAKGLREDLSARVCRRFGLPAEEYERLKALPKRGAPHFAGYWSGSYIVAKRRRYKASGREETDPEEWWLTYDHPGTRSSWLKAYAAEQLPELFEIVQVFRTPCSRCGGKGAVKKLSFREVKGIGHEWFEVCPRCEGVAVDRGVAYR